jgi:hypothetical protein
MPLKNYNAYFGNKKGSAAEAHAAMVRQYGAKKGNSVFYATINRKKKKGHRTEAMRRMLNG